MTSEEILSLAYRMASPQYAIKMVYLFSPDTLLAFVDVLKAEAQQVAVPAPMTNDQAWELTQCCHGISEVDGRQLIQLTETHHGITPQGNKT